MIALDTNITGLNKWNKQYVMSIKEWDEIFKN